MSLALYLFEKCAKKMDENISYITRKLSSPEGLVSHEASGALKDAAMGGMSGLADFAESYLTKNADALFFAALDATGLEKQISEAMAIFQNVLAAAFMAQNNIIYRMVKEIAWTTMEELAKKDVKLNTLAEKTRELYAALASLVGVPDYWPAYHKQLREALQLVASTRTDLQLVYNTFQRKDYWLGKRFDDTVTKLEKARDLITPKKNNPAVQKISEGSYKVSKAIGTPIPKRGGTGGADSSGPPGSDLLNTIEESNKRKKVVDKGFETMGQGLAIFGSGLSDNFPFPTTEQGWQATVLIGRLSNELLIEMQGYFGTTNKVNALVGSFKLSLGALNTGFPKFLKEYVLGRLQPTYDRVNTLVHGMALTLNGNEEAVRAPIAGFKPNSLSVTVNGFKWISDINLILQGYKAIPKSALNQMSLDQAAADKYKSIVAKIEAMYPGGALKSSMGRLSMTGGIEELGDLESQLLSFMLEANNAVISSSVRKSILPLGKAVLGRLELSLKADHQLYEYMLEWYNYPLPSNEVLDELFGGITRMLAATGLDRTLSAMLTGDYNALFSMKGMLGTAVGAGLAVLALLKSCKMSTDEKAKLNELENELNADMDLFNFNFSINFDLAIFKNFFDCFRLTGLSDLFTSKELLCGIAQDIANGNVDNLSAMYTKMKDAFTFDEKTF